MIEAFIEYHLHLNFNDWEEIVTTIAQSEPIDRILCYNGHEILRNLAKQGNWCAARLIQRIEPPNGCSILDEYACESTENHDNHL